MDEFRLPSAAALAEGGFTPDDIKEILLQQGDLLRRARGQPCRQRRPQRLSRNWDC